ncbi:amidohydrolase [Brevibacterium album]|uniref:amidohydrolase n=1 Tax=Brevibacterium album TaxID=417948 RepID=UPI0004046B36|nr:amidohydrolase [Brevibacterium album]
MTAQQHTQDRHTIFTGGEVLTVDARDSVAEAVSVRSGLIEAVGTSAEIEALASPETRRVELSGRTLMPGFVDAHAHLTMVGSNLTSVSCKDPSVRSVADLLEQLRTKAGSLPAGTWVRAWGFNDTVIAEGRYPTRAELDGVTTEHPLIVVRACGHISAVNSRALELAGIDAATPDPVGGRISRDDSGEPDGVLIESAHMRMFSTAALSDAELDTSNEAGSELFAGHGVTSIHDATGQGFSHLRGLQRAVAAGLVKQRIYAVVGGLGDSLGIVRDTMRVGIFSGLGDHRFRIGPLKLFLDGSSSGPTVWTREPYTSDPSTCGVSYLSQEELDEVFVEAHAQGWQLTSHAQGDAAIEMLLNTIERAQREHPRANARHRVEHGGLAAPDLVARMAELGVVPTANPAFHYEYGDSYIRNYGERVEHMYPLADYVRAGVPVAIGSDAPVTEVSPLRGIHAALTRRSRSGAEVGARQRVGLMDAVRMYTLNGARASHEDEVKGSVEVGKFADLVVLDRSLMSADVEEIPEVGVAMTMVGGEVVWEG